MMFDLVDLVDLIGYDGKFADSLRKLDQELVNKLVKTFNSPFRLEYLDHSLYPREVFMMFLPCVLARAGCVLRYCPAEFLTKELCETAIQSDPDAIKYVPLKMQTREMWISVLKQDGYLFFRCPTKFWSKELYQFAVSQYPSLVQYVFLPEYNTEEKRFHSVQNGESLILYDLESLSARPILIWEISQYNSVLLYHPLNPRNETWAEVVARNP